MSLFRHGVASGDPDASGVVIWTRVSDAGEQPVELGWLVARDPGLKSVVARGSAVAESDADHCVSVDVGGL